MTTKAYSGLDIVCLATAWGPRHGGINAFNSDFAAGYAVVNLSAARSVGVGSRSLRAYVRLNNAFDRRYVGSVIVNEGNRRFFEPAAGRAVLAGFDLAL